jgi:hypothetical protein
MTSNRTLVISVERIASQVFCRWADLWAHNTKRTDPS